MVPARDLGCGIAAIEHGADAVYIGAERFGARSGAGNSIEDIHNLCDYAHIFMAKVYVTVNTIVYDEELQATQELIQQLYKAGVDAILVQDMGIMELDIPPITLHASTQTDNRTLEKVRWLQSIGFSRVVLARELSLREIEEIHAAVPGVELEVFVHGALCVSYSGQCYASQYCFKRSANRGECAQFCRLKFDLEDCDGKPIESGKHLLSLKDLCLYDKLEQIVKAGATSLKIEGRLKDITYVKNVTAAYSDELNKIIARNPGIYRRASIGRSSHTFTPDLNKSFNRGYTHYFIDGRGRDVASIDTPKAMGEYVGMVKEIKGKTFNVAGTTVFTNGDGLCFINDRCELEGFRVNKVENNRIYPYIMPKSLKPGRELYRNNDYAFEKQLLHNSGERKIELSMYLKETENGFSLTVRIENVTEVTMGLIIEKQKALKPQRANIERQLTKLGNTPFECVKIRFEPEVFDWFIPLSQLAGLRQQAVEKLNRNLRKRSENKTRGKRCCGDVAKEFYPSKYSYLYNVSNKLSRKFYEGQGVSERLEAFEERVPKEKLLMQCRYCIRQSLGHCEKKGGVASKWHEPLFLKLSDGRRFRLQFDCTKCQMNVFAEN